MAGYRELLVWQKAMQLVKDVYDKSANFPKSEIYGITSQMRRAAVSIPSNIAEGNGRNSVKEYLNFLSIAKGSLAELETQITLTKMCDYINEDEENKLLKDANEIAKMLHGLKQKLQPVT